MLLIAFGVVVCSFGELNLVVKGLLTQLAALVFEVGIAAARPALEDQFDVLIQLHDLAGFSNNFGVRCVWRRRILLMADSAHAACCRPQG